MSNPLIEQFNKDVEDFEDFYFEIGRYEKRPLGLKPHKNFHTQSHLNLINKMIEECEGRKKDNAQEDQSVADEVYYEQQRNIGYNSALSDTISQLQEFKNYLLTNIK